jgi:hypothetical protein
MWLRNWLPRIGTTSGSLRALGKLGTVDEQEAGELAGILRPAEARQRPCDDTVYYRPAYFRLPQSPLVRSME